jgi:hypothetical protein
MKAIKTKYVSATITKPSRIRASAEGVPSKFYSVDSLQDEAQTDRADAWHGLAAVKFRDANDWKLPLVSGQTGPDDHVHCFVEPTAWRWGFLKGKDLVVAQARILVEVSPAPETGLPICDAYHFGLLKSALEQLDA